MIQILINKKNNYPANNERKFDSRFDLNQDYELNLSGLYKKWENKDEKFFIIGNLYGFRKNNFLEKISKNSENLKLLEDPQNVNLFEGRFILVKVCNKQKIHISTDNYGTVDIYFQNNPNQLILSTHLDSFVKSNDFNQIAHIHALTVYGARPSKKMTLYNDIHRLGVYEQITINANEYEIKKRLFEPISIKPEYKTEKLDDYTDRFLDAVKVRSSDEGNIVFLSSGWDSTSILASLVHLHGKSKVKCIIGKMRYSERSEVINQIEVDKAVKIAEYFGVKLHIIDFDYRKGAQEIVDESSYFFKNQHFSNMTGISHWRLSQEAVKVLEGNETIFAGEISDGAHNFGFSQYVTMFHPSSQDFREYSDKMASYLFGPTFYSVLKSKEHKNDPIWNLFYDRKKDLIFDDIKENNQEFNTQFLNSFFISPARMPLASLDNNKLITKFGASEFNLKTNKLYFEDVSKNLNSENLYSYYLHLYNSFHWQGSTVAPLEYCGDYFGFNVCLPFRDKSVIDFLSGMPEKWGRGLDFNNTKYPLKWMLKNRIDYPYKYQEGPHSYIYMILIHPLITFRKYYLDPPLKMSL